MTSLLAAGLMIGVGAGMLAWYYSEALSRPAAAGAAAHSSVPGAAGEGMTLPPFGPVASTRMPSIAASVPSATSAPTPAISAPRPYASRPSAPAATPQLDPLLEPPLERAPGGLPLGYGAPPRRSPRQQALDRRLSGEVYAGAGSGTSSNSAAPPLGTTQAPMPASGARGDELQSLLRPSVLSATRAQILPTQRLLLPKGTFIDCTLETAIDSTLPGMTTCVTANDTFGADGTVVLLERGTKLIGQTRGEVRQGDARVFIVWMEARTSSGVVIRLDSPGTDALGRSGLDGTINRHFWQRFGAAALVSTIDGVVQSEVQSSSRGGTVVLDPTASEDVLNDILRGTVNIPPTIRVRNGARIQVLVARDVDFRPVYELEPR
ncbi:MAG: type IV secretion system protein VirB10 [Steroidobacteraceae bacterium]